ncbi:hypothetical protein FAES_1347 [Fibrella aestuarina BUZ 2]|uniref:Uncharacterized protein n=1 Tax=Fibrella aestuarina BUZ 2 TaxID=1166018 RepID=I0K5F4_9BACT|nr:hypothetical protein [Fibrella aestuarina]CCG99357.1 hypothetical protein FAES_1347 [Fibrella aestuarina BUZ 2]
MIARLLLLCALFGCRPIGSRAQGFIAPTMAVSYEGKASNSLKAVAAVATTPPSPPPAPELVRPWVRLNARPDADGTVRVQWQTHPKQVNKTFLLERSADGITWEPLGQVSGNETASGKNTYEFVSAQPLASERYRLFCLLADNTKLYSSVVALVSTGQPHQAVRYYAAQQSAITVGLLPSRLTFPVTVNVYTAAGAMLCYDSLVKSANEFMVELPATKESTLRLQVVDASNRVVLMRNVAMPSALQTDVASAPRQ